MTFMAEIYGVGPIRDPFRIEMPSPGYYELVGRPESGKDTALRALHRVLEPDDKGSVLASLDLADGDRGHVTVPGRQANERASLSILAKQVRRSGQAGFRALDATAFLDLTRPAGGPATARRRELDAWATLARIQCRPAVLLRSVVIRDELDLGDMEVPIVELRDLILDVGRDRAGKGPSREACLEALRRIGGFFVPSQDDGMDVAVQMAAIGSIALGFLEQATPSFDLDTFQSTVGANFLGHLSGLATSRWAIQDGTLMARSPVRRHLLPYHTLSGSTRDLLALGLLLRALGADSLPPVLILPQPVGDGMTWKQKVSLSGLASQTGVRILSAHVSECDLAVSAYKGEVE